MRASLLCGASGAAVAICLSLAASEALAADATAAATASSSAASPEGTTIGELVVVAEKRQQNLETVPVSVSAFTAADRDLKGIATVQDLTDYTPGLAYTTFDNRPYIRGIGRNTDNLAVESGVAVYVDGVYFGANASTILQTDSLFVDQIEVLRGPQSTLYGRNADGGAINYVSVKPPSQFEAEIRTGYANYDKWFIEGATGGPITDTLRFRIGANYTSQTGGYYTNFSGAPEGGSVAQGGDGYSSHAEFQVQWNPNSQFEWWAKVATSDYNTTYHTETLIGPYDTREYPNPLFPNQNYGLCALPGGSVNPGCSDPSNLDAIVPGSVVTLPGTALTNPTALNIRDFNADFKSNSSEDQNIIVATTLTYHFPSVDLKYIGGFQRFLYDLTAPWVNSQGISSSVESYQLQGPSEETGLCALNFDNAGCTQNLTVNPAYTNFTFVENEYFFSHEINLSSTTNGRLQWIAGLYWYHEHYQQPINVDDGSQSQVLTPQYMSFTTFTLSPAPLNPTGSVYNEDTVLTEDSYAGFAQVDWKVTDTIKLTGGFRYTADHKFGAEGFRLILFDADSLVPGFPLGVNQFGANTPALDFTSCPALPAPGVQFPGTGPCTINPTNGKGIRPLGASWSAPTGNAVISWTPDSDTMVYGKYSRGYKTGGFNSGILASNPETAPEYVDAFEAGFKQTIAHKFQANFAAFYYDYYNDQQPLGETINGVISTLIINIPTVHSYGAELEALWQPVRNLTLNLSYAYLNSTIASMNGQCYQDTADPEALAPGANTAGCSSYGAGYQNLTGQRLPETPHNKISLNGLYKFEFNPGNLTFSGTFIWKDQEYDSVFNRSYNSAPAYTQVNLRATWTDTKNRYSVIVFCNNLFDTIGYDGAGGLAVTAPGPSQIVDSEVSLTAPRTFGVEFQYRFK